MANRFWVGGTGTFDAADTTHWSATTGGAGGASVPGSADVAILDGSSGGGTVTVNHATLTLGGLTFGAFGGTLDFATNNNNITITGGCTGSGSGTRTLNMGSGTWTLTSTGGTFWDFTTVTGLTFNKDTATLLFAAGTVTANRTPQLGAGLSYPPITVSQTGGFQFVFQFGGGANTIAALNLTPPLVVHFPNGVTTTISTAFTWTGTAYNNGFLIRTGTSGATATISVASGTPTIEWAGIHNIICTGGATFSATNSLDLKGNSGITISPPGGAAAAKIISG